MDDPNPPTPKLLHLQHLSRPRPRLRSRTGEKARGAKLLFNHIIPPSFFLQVEARGWAAIGDAAAALLAAVALVTRAA